MDDFVPLVPYASHDEYEELRLSLVTAYETSIDAAMGHARLVSADDGLHTADSWMVVLKNMRPERGWSVHLHWQAMGEDHFMELTKGRGARWCAFVNHTVVQALDASIRALGQAFAHHAHPIGEAPDDAAFIRSELKRAARHALLSALHGTPHYNFFKHNFQRLGSADGSARHVPVAVLQAMRLAFAMVAHPRLGGAAAGRSLGLDLVKHILSPACFLDDDGDGDGDGG